MALLYKLASNESGVWFGAVFKPGYLQDRTTVAAVIRPFLYLAVACCSLSNYLFANFAVAYFLYRHNPESEPDFDTSFLAESVKYEVMILAASVLFAVIQRITTGITRCESCNSKTKRKSCLQLDSIQPVCVKVECWNT